MNGVEVGSAEDEYVWPNNSDSNIRRFLFDQKMTPGGSISAVAVLKGNMEKEPVILIALYEDNMLKEVKTGSVVRSENGETELRATLSNLPESVSGCTVKAFLLKDLGSIEPMPLHQRQLIGTASGWRTNYETKELDCGFACHGIDGVCVSRVCGK